MSYPRPPEGPGSAGPYGYPPQQGQVPMPPPPPMPPSPPPGAPQGWQGTPAYGGQGSQGAPYGGQGTPPYAGQGQPYGGQGHQGAPYGAGSAPQPPPPARAQKSTGRSCLAAFLGITGALAMLGGGALTAHAYSNHSQNIPNRTEYGASMWRNEPADKLFPDFVAPRQGTGQARTPDRKRAQWHRIGISEKTGCDDGLSGATATQAEKLGCKAVLRATYVDPTGNTVATVALIVLPKSDSVKTEMSTFFDAEKEKDNPGPGVKAYAVPGTIAAKWSDARANGSAGQSVTDLYLPYALMASAGSVDGRKAGELPGEWGKYSIDAKQDRAPWRGAADGLVDALNVHYLDLLTEGTS
ncbi:hypothetical protein [Streptomyces sp. Rer75]|uniref:hypothetical protein n=1 Tax=unclassified Streptomyces TaxID=2593676 RepID=UPI00211EDACB|nr:hypothetical protein [Streptomyces sp. Rer75]